MKKYNKLRFLLFFLVTGNILGNMNPEGFGKFRNYYFVETGTYEGAGIKLALKANFSEIFSIEIVPKFATIASSTFANYQNVHIIEGDSGKILWDVIKHLDKPITFWLDGHNSWIPTEKNSPLMEELEQIKRHPIKNHTIIIDDMHCCGTIHFDYLTKTQIINKILEINPRYKIKYINGGVAGEIKNNILVASAAQ